jgi:hypothetical protein
MPRKPSSIFLITEHPTTTTQPPGMPPTQLQCWRIPLPDDTTPEQLIEQHLHAQPIGTTMYVVDDTKVTAYRAGLTLNEVDDPRLQAPSTPQPLTP